MVEATQRGLKRKRHEHKEVCVYHASQSHSDCYLQEDIAVKIAGKLACSFAYIHDVMLNSPVTKAPRLERSQKGSKEG